MGDGPKEQKLLPGDQLGSCCRDLGGWEARVACVRLVAAGMERRRTGQRHGREGHLERVTAVEPD